MKKIFSVLMLFVITFHCQLHAQDSTTKEKSETSVSKKSNSDFEGVIVYEISFPNLQLDERTKALMPKEMKLYIKGNQQRLEMAQTTSVKSVTITDSQTQTSTILMDMMGKKLAMKVGKEDVEKELAKTKMPKIEYGDATKMIAGYACKKADMIYEDGKKSTIYFTDQIQMENYNVNWNYQLPQLKGFPLEFEMDQKGTKMKMSAVKVSKELVPITLFMVPEGYQEVTREQLQGAFGGDHDDQHKTAPLKEEKPAPTPH